ncbi:unnamed protein product [Moneuplotes crassus]|uniref:Uncharacterized protein n=1 Tax=Euplotes crassus TaxID=5936 RepID=A0AAD1XD06_EUPCR|nr:unnamed protein product [Moneuplotes crassus]
MPKTRKTSRSMMNEPKYLRRATPKSTKRSSRLKRSNSKEPKRCCRKKSTKKVSFNDYIEDPLSNPIYASVINRNRHDASMLADKINQLEEKLETEIYRRKMVERERDDLVISLNDMTMQTKDLEKSLKGFKTENIDLYQLLKQNNKDILFAKQQAENYYKDINDLKQALLKEENKNASLQKVIEDQKLLIGQQSMEMAQLKITNKAYDLSNKENVRNMNLAFGKVLDMSHERKKVSNELDNIIQRRKSKKNLQGSNSFKQLANLNTGCMNSQRGISSTNNLHCCQHSNEKPGLLIDRSYSDARMLNMNQ